MLNQRDYSKSAQGHCTTGVLSLLDAAVRVHRSAQCSAMGKPGIGVRRLEISSTRSRDVRQLNVESFRLKRFSYFSAGSMYE